MASNQFQPFANGGGANRLTPAAYAALTTLISQGYQGGTALSEQLNTTWAQSSNMASAWGEIIEAAGGDALDDGNIATLWPKLIAALIVHLSPSLAGTPGDYRWTAVNVAPTGPWILANGALLLRAGTYAALFARIGTTFNVGGEDGTQFRIPDMRGVVMRGLDLGRGLDPGRVLNNAVQMDQNKQHHHGFTSYDPDDGASAFVGGGNDTDNPTPQVTQDEGGSEARMKNLAGVCWIRY